MNTAYILTGGNLGERLSNMKQVKNYLEKDVGKIIKSSSVYETAAWGNNDQPDFYNQVQYSQNKIVCAGLNAICFVDRRKNGSCENF